MEALIQERRYDVVAISGDLSQRARSGEFQRARAFIRHAERVEQGHLHPRQPRRAVVEGAARHRRRARMFATYRRYIAEDIEPVLRVPGATFAGLNTSHGVAPQTLTWNAARHLDHRHRPPRADRAAARGVREVAARRRARRRHAPQPGEGRAVAAPRAQEHPARPRRVRRDGGGPRAVRARPSGRDPLHRAHEARARSSRRRVRYPIACAAAVRRPSTASASRRRRSKCRRSSGTPPRAASSRDRSSASRADAICFRRGDDPSQLELGARLTPRRADADELLALPARSSGSRASRAAG